MPSRRDTGFSLIELLVSIAIIALLIGITLPVLSSARDAAKSTVCSSNLRQVGIGVELYLEAFKGMYPDAAYMPAPWLSKVRQDEGQPGGAGTPEDSDGLKKVPSFQRAMNDFIDERSEVYKCPGDKWIFSLPVSASDPFGQIAGTSYTYITFLAGRTLDDMQRGHFAKMRPSEIPVMHDYDNSPLVTGENEGGYETEDGRRIEVPYFHLSRNVLYADLSISKPIEP